MNGWEFANSNPWFALCAVMTACWSFAMAIGGLRKPADGALVNFLRLAVTVVPFLIKLYGTAEQAKKPSKKEKV